MTAARRSCGSMRSTCRSITIMGTGAFQPGPVADMPETIADAAFAVANVVPDTSYATTDYSPVFRYPYATAATAVAAAPPARDGSRRVRYVNPLNGGSAMALIDCFLVQLDPGTTTLPFRTTANSVCCVVEGAGESQVGNETIRGRSGTSSRCRKATGSFTGASAAPPGCSRSPTATSMPGSAC